MKSEHDEKLMSPFHPDWEEFLMRLEGPEGCNFRPNGKGSTTWDCSSDPDFFIAQRVLKSMGFDHDTVMASCILFMHAGAGCDCEILFNVRAENFRRTQ